MDIVSERKVQWGVEEFKSSVFISTDDDPNEIIRTVMEGHPEMLYYIDGYSIKGFKNNYEIKLEYKNTNTNSEDIHIVRSLEECESLMCDYASRYKKRLVVIVKRGIGLENAVNDFIEIHSSFYPNITGVSRTEYETSDCYHVCEYDFIYRLGNYKLNSMEAEVTSEVKRIAKMLFLPGMPPEAKIYLAHNYLAVTVDYRLNRDNNLATGYTQSAYGALIKKECVCQGYAEAFKRLMDAAGVACNVIHGKCSGSKNGHAWNIVSLGQHIGNFHVDVTWDASDESPEYSYFCKPDSYFDGKRTWRREHFPACSSNYSVLNAAKKYINSHITELKNRGIPYKIIDLGGYIA